MIVLNQDVLGDLIKIGRNCCDLYSILQNNVLTHRVQTSLELKTQPEKHVLNIVSYSQYNCCQWPKMADNRGVIVSNGPQQNADQCTHIHIKALLIESGGGRGAT